MKRMRRMGFLALIMLILASMPFAVYAVDGQIKIAQTADTTFPIIINKPGSYVLTSNITVNTPDVNAIEIQADRVTLDLNGHVITGPNQGTGKGIYAGNFYNITIKNGTITEFQDGIFLENNSADSKGGDFSIDGIQARRNLGYGIYASYSTIKNCITNNNDTGIYAKKSTINNCSAHHNINYGIYIEDCVLANSSTNYNRSYGVWAIRSTMVAATSNYNSNGQNSGLGISAYHCTLEDCVACYNRLHGIYAFDSSVKSCTVYNNQNYGIKEYRGTVSNCTANDNGSAGISAYYSLISNCTTYSNTGDGIAVEACVVKGCNVRNNSGYGIHDEIV